MSSKDSGKHEPTILGVAEASVPYTVNGTDGADASRSPRYRALNLARLAEQGMLTHDGGRSAVAEDFRIIKRPLLRQARASGSLSPEDESELLGRLLTHWALRSTLDTSELCADVVRHGRQSGRPLPPLASRLIIH